MMRRLITTIILLVFLTDSTGLNRLSLRPQQLSDGLRPLSMLISGKASKDPKSSSAGVSSSLVDITLDLSSEDKDEIALFIVENMFDWIGEGRQICLSCTPKTDNELTAAQALGFVPKEAEAALGEEMVMTDESLAVFGKVMCFNQEDTAHFIPYAQRAAIIEKDQVVSKIESLIEQERFDDCWGLIIQESAVLDKFSKDKNRLINLLSDKYAQLKNRENDKNEKDLPVYDLCLSLSTEEPADTDSSLKSLSDKVKSQKKSWYARGKPLSLTSKAFSQEQAVMARRLGFEAEAKDEIAQAVYERIEGLRVKDRRKTLPPSSRYRQELMLHTIDFPGKGIAIRGSSYKSILLVTTDNHSTNQMANAIKKNNPQPIKDMIENNEAIPLAFELIAAKESLLTLSRALGLDEEEANEHLVSHQKRESLILTQQKQAKDDKQNQEKQKEKDRVALRIRRLIKLKRLTDALKLLETTTALSDFKSDEANLILELAQKYNENNDFSKAADMGSLLNKCFGKNPKGTKVREYIQKFTKAAEKARRKAAELDMKAKEKRVDKLLKEGRWWQAWEAAGGDSLKKPAEDPLCQKVMKTARRPENAPDWLSRKECLELLEMAKQAARYDKIISAIALKGEVPFRINEDLRKDFRIFAKRLALLDEGVFSRISNLAKAFCFSALKADEMYFTMEGWPDTIEKFRSDFIPWIRLPDDNGDRTIRDQHRGTLQAVVGFYDAVKALYDIEDPNDGKWRLERLSGEPQKGVGSGISLIFTLFEEDKSKESQRQVCKRNLLAGGVISAQLNSAVFGKEILAEYLRGFLEHKAAFPILPALGGELYPAFSLPCSFLFLGARPMLAPAELASKLKDEYILKKEVIATSSGASAIRIFMKDSAYFDGPLYPGVSIVYLYPLKAGCLAATVSEKKAKEMLENWDETLDSLSNSEWEGEKARFVAGGIDYAFESQEGLKRLIDMLMPEASNDEKSETLKEIQARQAEARERGYRIPGGGKRFRAGHYSMLSVLLNHWISCDYVCSDSAEKKAAAKRLAAAFSDPVFRDIRLQSSLLTALGGNPNMLSVLEDIVDVNKHSEALLILARNSVEAHLSLRCDMNKSLEAPRDIITGWDPDAPKTESSEETEARRTLWYITVELIADILSASIIKGRFLDNILFHLDEKNRLKWLSMNIGKTIYQTDTKTYPMDTRCLRVLSKLGFEPFIAESGLADIANNARAHKSVEVISPTEKSPPCIAINLDDDWEILEDEAWDAGYLQGTENEVVTDRLVFVLIDDNGVVMDEKEYEKYVDKERRCLVMDADGNCELSKVIGTYARAAIPYLLSDVNRFRSAVKALATDSKYISPKVDRILHSIPTGRRPYRLHEVISCLYEQNQVDIALEKSSEHQARFGLEAALKVIARAQERFPDNQLLKQKRRQLERLITRADLLSRVSRRLSQRSRLGADELNEAFKELISFYSDGETLSEEMLIKAMAADRKGLRLYRSLKDSVGKAKTREELLAQAQACFEEDALSGARDKATEAQEKSWPGADIDTFLEKIAKREHQIAARLIEDELSDISAQAAKADTLADPQQLSSSLKKAEHRIEDLLDTKARSRLISRLEEIQQTIFDNIEKIEADLQAKRDRLSLNLKSLRANILSIPIGSDDLKGYDIKKGPTREGLRIWGRELRSLEREISSLTTENDQPLKELVAQVSGLYSDRQAQLRTLINTLKKDVVVSLDEAKAAVSISEKAQADSTIEADFQSAQEIIAAIPSTEVQSDLIGKLERRKKEIKTAMDKREAKDIDRTLKAKLEEIEAMQETDVKAPDESLRARIEQIGDDELKQSLLDKFDDITETYRLKRLSIEQRRIIEANKQNVEVWLHLIRSISPVSMSKWLERGSKNAYKDMIRYLDSLDTEDPQAKEYVDKLRREVESIKEAKLANLERFQSSRRRPPRCQTLESIERPDPEPLGQLEQTLSQPQEKPAGVQRIRPTKLEVQLKKAATQEQLMMDYIMSFNLKQDQIAPERGRYMAIRDAARERRESAPSADDLELNRLMLSEMDSAA